MRAEMPDGKAAFLREWMKRAGVRLGPLLEALVDMLQEAEGEHAPLAGRIDEWVNRAQDIGEDRMSRRPDDA